MRRLQRTAVFIAPIVALLVFADPAFATTHGGTGLFGNTNDSQITNTMFFLLGFFPVVIIVLSVFQGFLDNRKHKKIEAEKAARAADPHRGGW
jgi:preprotein translocase subunit SecG